MSTINVKRKRGRPRRDEPPEINEFDIALIREFADRPAFYDRSCVHYRNRDYLEMQWEEMAQTLGYNVAMLKDRMIQLRNRYNLEKRRAEMLQDQYHDTNITSQWPLYEYMSFLGDFIKPRRPYSNSKTHLRGVMPQRRNNSSHSSEADYEESHNNSDVDSESDMQKPNIKLHSNSMTHTTIDHSGEPHTNTHEQGIRILSTQTHNKLPQNKQQKTSVNPHQLPQQQLQQQSQQRRMFGERRQELSVEKYKAFGQFLAASLIEMSELDALQLVNKFTADVVKTLRSDFRTKSTLNSNDSAEISI